LTLEKSSPISQPPPAHKLTPAQIALIVIGSMLASIFITLTLSFLLLRYKKQAKLRQEKELLSSELETSRAMEPSVLPIAASMRKRAPGEMNPPPAQESLPEQANQVPNPEMTVALSFSAFHQEDKPDALAGELRDRLTQLEASRSSQKHGRVYIPPSPPSPMCESTGSVQQAKQVKFETIRAVENVPALLGRDKERDRGEEGFTVSRTVMRSKSKKGEKGKGIEIGVRTWVESGSGSD
jgi:hypothetical protein